MKFRGIAALLLAALCALNFIPASADETTCTVMFYCCGSDLESEYCCATVNIAQMLEADLGENVKVTLGVGGAKDWKNPYFSDGGFDIWSIGEYPGQEAQWSGLPAFYETDNVRYDLPWRSGTWSVPAAGLLLEKECGERDMSNPDTLREFLEFSAEKYPADRYFLILWDHGGGPAGGFGVDEMNPRRTLSTRDIHDAIADSDLYFDFIGFDACLMGSWEIALRLSDCGDYLIASEETEPGWGWDQTGWLNLLGEDPGAPVQTLGRKIIDDFIEGSEAGQSDATLSMVDLTALRAGPLSALDVFSLDMDNVIRSGGFARLSQARAGAKYFSDKDSHLVDMIHLAELAGGDAAQALADALAEVIVYNRTTRSVDDANGLSLYFPYNDTDAVDTMLALYREMGLAEDWQQMVTDFSALLMSGNVEAGTDMRESFGAAGGLGASAQPEDTPSGEGFFSSLFGQQQTETETTGFFSWLQDGMQSGAVPEDVPGFFEGLNFAALGAVELETPGLAQSGDALVIDWKDDGWVLQLPAEDWELITNVELRVYLDDGEGYIELGCDDAVNYNDDGDLLVEFDYSWVALDGQIVTFYSGPYTEREDGYFRYTGYVPCYVNDEHAELWLAWDSEHDGGYVMGYCDPMSENPMRRGMHSLRYGDEIKPLCDFYDYDFEYDDEYLFGDAIEVRGELQVTYEDIDLSYDTVILYELTDVFCNEYITEMVSYTD